MKTKMDMNRYKALPIYKPCVYVIRHPELAIFKIGMTCQPRTRIKKIAWKHRVYVDVVAIISATGVKGWLYADEDTMHKQFASKRVEFAGEKEWFDLTDNDIAEIKMLGKEDANG